MTRVFDETFQEEDSEASDITLLEERLRSLPLRDDYDECQTDDSASMDSTSTRARSERGFLPSCKCSITRLIIFFLHADKKLQY